MNHGARRVALALLVSFSLGGALSETAYTVQPGDTLSRIAQRHGVTVEALQGQNGLTGTLIRPGQRLLIPGGSAAGPRAALHPAPDLPPGFGLHRLEVGETVEAVASRYGLSAAALLGVNADLVSGGAPTALFLRVPPRPGLLLRLERDADVLSLALAYGLAPSDLQRANGLSTPNLAAGRWVFIPGVLSNEVTNEVVTVVPSEVTSEPLPPAAAGTVAALPGTGATSRDVLRGRTLAELARAAERLAAYSPGDRALAFRWPLARRGVVSSGFGPRSLRVAGGTFHSGIDIVAPVGTPVLAVSGGVVSRAGWGGHYGYVVYLDHGGAVQTRYAHMNRIDVALGQRVQGGGQLGVVGETGATTGPHLHFEIRVGGRAVDPRAYLP